jgi:hypothetical protein
VGVRAKILASLNPSCAITGGITYKTVLFWKY